MNTCYIKYEPILLELKKFKCTMVSLTTDRGPNDWAGDKNCQNKLKFCQLEIFPKKQHFFEWLKIEISFTGFATPLDLEHTYVR